MKIACAASLFMYWSMCMWFERRGTRSNVYVFLFHGVIFKIKTLVFKAKGIKFRSRFWQCMKIYNKINFHQTCMMTLLLRTVEWSWFPLHLSPKQLAPWFNGKHEQRSPNSTIFTNDKVRFLFYMLKLIFFSQIFLFVCA